jgi:hypothetical protein
MARAPEAFKTILKCKSCTCILKDGDGERCAWCIREGYEDWRLPIRWQPGHIEGRDFKDWYDEEQELSAETTYESAESSVA